MIKRITIELRQCINYKKCTYDLNMGVFINGFCNKGMEGASSIFRSKLCKRLHAAIPCADSLVLVYILIVNRHS